MIHESNWYLVLHGDKSKIKEPFYSQVTKDSSDSSGQSGSPSHNQLWETQVTWSWQRNSPGSHDCWSEKENGWNQVWIVRTWTRGLMERYLRVHCFNCIVMNHIVLEQSDSMYFLKIHLFSSSIQLWQAWLHCRFTQSVPKIVKNSVCFCDCRLYHIKYGIQMSQPGSLVSIKAPANDLNFIFITTPNMENLDSNLVLKLNLILLNDIFWYDTSWLYELSSCLFWHGFWNC